MGAARGKTPEQIAKEIKTLQEANIKSALAEINKVLEKRGLIIQCATQLIIGPGGQIQDRSQVVLLPRPPEAQNPEKQENA